MNCETARSEMQKALDAGQEQLAGEAAHHAEECEPCRAHWQQLRRIEALMTVALGDRVTMPSDLHGGLMDRLRREATAEHEPAGHGVMRWVLAAAAALIVVAVVSALLFPPDRLSPRQASSAPPLGISPASIVTGFLSNPIPDIEKAAPARAIAAAGASAREFGMSILSPASAALRALQVGEPSVQPESTPRAID